MPTSTEPLSRRVRVDNLDLHCKRLKGKLYTDILISKVKSILGNTVSNIYTQGKFVKFYPITDWIFAGKSLIDFTYYVSVPEAVLTGGDGDFTERITEFVKNARWMRMQIQS